MPLMNVHIEYALYRAIRDGDLQKLKGLISAGANVHTCKDENEYWRYAIANERAGLLNEEGSLLNEYPLNAACRMGSTSIVKELLKSGACVNARPVRGCTPLHKAVESHTNLEIIKVLLENGADINMACQHGYFTRVFGNCLTVLDYAIVNELTVAKLLIKLYLLKTCNFKKLINVQPNWNRVLIYYNTIVEYFDDCVSEIVQMKTEMMNQQISLYDIVSKEGILLSSNSEWVKKIKDIMIERHPVYHDIIADKIEMCIRRRILLKKLKEPFCLTLQENQIVWLEPISVEIIASYLTTEDLSNLVAALSNSVQSNDNCSSKSEEI